MNDRETQPSVPNATAQQNADIRLILDGTAAETGAQFFHALVSNLARVLGTAGAWVTEYLPESRRLNARAMWYKGDFVSDYEYDIAGTPCEPVIEKQCLVHIPKGVSVRFPDDPDLEPFGAVSYMGMPLLGHDGAVIGHLAVLDTKPMPHQEHLEALFRIFGARAGAELRRLRAENEAREREEQLVRLVDSAMDAILELDHQWHVTRANRAVTKIFDHELADVIGKPIDGLLDSGSAAKLRRLTGELNKHPDGPHCLWIPGGIKAVSARGNTFPVEGSLSRFDHAGATFHTLILRDLNEKLEAERRILSLEHEAEYLREELADLHNFRSIIGSSPALKKTLAAVQQVAGTDSTVLILGETGTGKELIARAIHSESNRRDRPLIKVNCAAIPAALIESEFFGHERGAFTGATQRREGRFTLADGGTIFLDEVGELPIDLQAKLLRVLQEGELEPVGSSRTLKVDVRVIAATNRDLKQAVKDGTFREDLYYRLNVIPIAVPPLRERGHDVILLAESFARSFSQQTGRPVEPISATCRDALLSYPWPGNIRELQNVVERAIITSRNGHLNMAGVIPLETPPRPSQHSDPNDTVLTDAQMRKLERANIERALRQAGGKLSGDSGAAALLGIPPSTLASRMKSLKIDKPT